MQKLLWSDTSDEKREYGGTDEAGIELLQAIEKTLKFIASIQTYRSIRSEELAKGKVCGKLHPSNSY